jgi:hypothetical protein
MKRLLNIKRCGICLLGKPQSKKKTHHSTIPPGWCGNQYLHNICFGVVSAYYLTNIISYKNNSLEYSHTIQVQNPTKPGVISATGIVPYTLKTAGEGTRGIKKKKNML